ncbi:nesprin-2-like isoform X3 [Centruroides sculpturatus]|uniref:nesprin-2-like isoform X3 n=1 Tax=Centruroides sculpturatus TaxID=218467 RepID=UPI000C6EBC49|nr:nesprin-2-like isoform X3 [Centruroides sculpturatus]
MFFSINYSLSCVHLWLCLLFGFSPVYYYASFYMKVMACRALRFCEIVTKHWRYLETFTCLHVCSSCRNRYKPRANKYVVDLFEDLRDGHNLISLLEVLSGELLPRERGKMRFHMLQNVQIALDFLRYRKVSI